MTQFQPIIILGMHRSGTTMIADLLQKLGLYLGWVLQENSEALFFVERNERLMNVCGGGWEQPDVVGPLLNDPAMRAQAAQILQQDLRSFKLFSYLGPNKLRYLGGPHRFDFPWGWKDPRNTFLLPLWLDLFPNARLIHIYRHGIDVAASLRVRESRSVEKRLGEFSTSGISKVAHKLRRPEKESPLLYAYRRVTSATGRLDPLRKYNKLNVASTISLENGFDLWCLYLQKCLDNLAAVNNQTLTIKYEDFLAEPETQLETLRQFCGLDGDRQTVKQLCSTLRTERRYAFTKDPKSLEFFSRVKDHPLIRKFGYDSV